MEGTAGKLARDERFVPEQQLSEEAPKKPVTLIHAISLIVGSIIGSGIFVSPEVVLVQSGSVGSSLLIWLAAGIISTLGALSFAELGTTYPKCGGVYKYLKEMFGPLPSFVTLWSYIVVIEPCVGAILSRTLANNLLAPFYEGCKPPQSAVRLIAAWALCLVSMVNCYSRQLVLRVQTTIASSKVIALVIIISLGMWTLIGSGHTENLKEPFSAETSAEGVALAFYSALFAYSGWCTVNAVVGQLEKPHRNLLLAVGISLPLVTTVYVLVNVAYVVVLPYETLVSSTSVAVTFGQQYAYWLAWIIPACIAFSVYGTLNGKTYTTALVIQVSAREGQFPFFGSMIHSGRRTLLPAFIFQCILGVIYVNFDTFTLMGIFSFVARSADVACVAGLILYRFKRPDLRRTFRNPLMVPVLYVCSSVFIVVVSTVGDPTKALTGLGVIIMGIPAYYIVNKGINVQFLEKFMRKLNLAFIGLAELTLDDETD